MPDKDNESDDDDLASKPIAATTTTTTSEAPSDPATDASVGEKIS